MIRRSPLALIAALAVLAGCGAVGDNDTVARVGADVLTEADVRAILDGTVPDTAEVPYDAANAAISNWILDRVLRADLAAGGSPIDEVDGDLSDATLRESFDASFQAWTTAEPTAVTSTRLASAFAAGPSESGMVCAAHILVADLPTADDLLAQLDDGADFATLAGEHSTDPGSAANGGALPCSSLSTFTNTYVFEFSAAVVDAMPGDVIGPVESQFGQHIIRVRPFDDLTEADIDTLLQDGLVRFAFAADAAGVSVDPRFGEFDAARGLVPVG
mgnify:CR=1 FL=1